MPPALTSPATATLAPGLSRSLPDLSLGYVPLTDAAPLLVAEEKDFFRRFGLRVAVAPAASWAALRDRVAFGAWDGAQMLAPMPIAAALGLGGVRAGAVVSATLGRNGNTLVFGRALADALGDAGFPAPAAAIAAAVGRFRAGVQRPPTLAVVFPFSSHNYLLRHLLAQGGIDPDRDVRLVVMAPPSLPEALASGAIDGFCAGEPWGSRAVDLRVGRIVLPSRAVWPDHPEKVLAFSAELALRDPARVEAATAAVVAAADWLSHPGHMEEAAAILHRRALPQVPPEVISAALAGRLLCAPDAAAVAVPRAIAFGVAETCPDPAHAAWFLAAMARWGHVPEAAALPQGLWRPDIWHRAVAAAGLAPPPALPADPPPALPCPPRSALP